jgi:hypothetical protein
MISELLETLPHCNEAQLRAFNGGNASKKLMNTNNRPASSEVKN